ncbi:MAG: hypothetical protein JJ916_13100 [Phycisphaerales bacterium]|nr:hypothetical protein [Phycisphaerales bacterium]
MTEQILPKQMLIPERGSHVARFWNQFSGEELCRLFEEVTAALCDQSQQYRDYVTRSIDTPGIIHVYRMMKSRGMWDIRLQLTESVLRVIRQHTKENLWVVHNVYWMFVHDEERFGLHESIGSIWEQMEDCIIRSFSLRDPMALVSSLSKSDPYQLWRLVRYIDGAGLDDSWDPDWATSSVWVHLEPIVLYAAEVAPERGIPILLPFVTRSSREDKTESQEERMQKFVNNERIFEPVGHFIEDEARGRFKTYLQLLRILAAAPPITGLDNDMIVMLESARKFAQQELSKREQ